MLKKITGLAVLSAVLSCASGNTAVKKTHTPKNTRYTHVQKAPKKEVGTKKMLELEKGYFFTENIADITKNDNTASHGSIVEAKPMGYTVSKEFFPSLGQNFRQRYLIVHYTAMDQDSSVRALTKNNVSSHYLVGDENDKKIYLLVDENKRAYHAGNSGWRGDSNLNDASLGIEIVNKGYTTDATGNRVFYPYPEYQFRKVAQLMKDIVKRYNIKPKNILGHSDIAPTRKQDPGPLFPWKRLYTEYGIGMWYDTPVRDAQLQQILASQNWEQEYNTMVFITKVQLDLQKFGYAIPTSGVWDDTTKKTIQAFQYHFRPEKADGVLDPETYAVLKALLLKYSK